MTTIYGDYYADLAILSALKGFGLDARWFLSNKDRRLKECVAVKGCAQRLLYDEKKFTLQFIGGLFEKHHSTIINNIAKQRNFCETDRVYKSKYGKARKIFLNYLADSE